jgi:hypothetical protein
LITVLYGGDGAVGGVGGVGRVGIFYIGTIFHQRNHSIKII